VKGAIDMGDLVEVRAFRQRRWPTGLVPFWRGGGRLYGIRKGRTARMVRRCLRREQQRIKASLRAQRIPTGDHMAVWRDPNGGFYRVPSLTDSTGPW
jgi:hypothetical protein